MNVIRSHPWVHRPLDYFHWFVNRLKRPVQLWELDHWQFFVWLCVHEGERRGPFIQISCSFLVMEFTLVPFLRSHMPVSLETNRHNVLCCWTFLFHDLIGRSCVWFRLHKTFSQFHLFYKSVLSFHLLWPGIVTLNNFSVDAPSRRARCLSWKINPFARLAMVLHFSVWCLTLSPLLMFPKFFLRCSTDQR